MRRIVIAALVLALGSLACSDGDASIAADGTGSDTSADPASPPGSDTLYQGTFTVLESPDHGPQLCTSVAQSYPPQCSGPDVDSWDWSTVDAESANGTTWGHYAVTGTWDGDSLTLTKAPSEPDRDDRAPSDTEFPTPCDPPADGWTVTDPETATVEGREAATDYAQAQSDFGGLWVDRSFDPDTDVHPIAGVILNVQFTGDLERHESELRERFGGPVCVSRSEHTEAELRAIQQSTYEEIDDAHYASTDIVRGVVEIGVFVTDPTVQAALDEEHGAGVVELVPALHPVDGEPQ
ncbi:MAG: hypothetical protein U5K30_14650 [Acidimicrobiales bacterium]|nr:hypothetical protein [Acidimicrobiales bacterium]